MVEKQRNSSDATPVTKTSYDDGQDVFLVKASGNVAGRVPDTYPQVLFQKPFTSSCIRVRLE